MSDHEMKPIALMCQEGLDQIKDCNGVSVWCENPAIFDDQCPPPSILVPVYHRDHVERLHAENQQLRKDIKTALEAYRALVRRVG